MPHCLKCNKHFPSSIKFAGKERYLHRRKYCLDCSPFGLHNTRKIAEQSVSNTKCVACQKPTRKGMNLCPACWTKMRRYQVKLAAIAYKGGRCAECNQVVPLAAFEFHHKDASTKRFDLGPCANRSLASIRDELDKCDLLCANCHRAKHSFCEQTILDYVAAHPIDFACLGG